MWGGVVLRGGGGGEVVLRGWGGGIPVHCAALLSTTYSTVMALLLLPLLLVVAATADAGGGARVNVTEAGVPSLSTSGKHVSLDLVVAPRPTALTDTCTPVNGVVCECVCVRQWSDE